MAYVNKGELKKVSIALTINSSIEDEDYKEFLKDFNRLESKHQHIIFDIMEEATDNILVEHIEEMKPFPIPFIGRILVGVGKKIEIAKTSIVAKKYGYESLDDMPKDIYVQAKSELEDIVRYEFTKVKKKRKFNRLNPTKKISLNDCSIVTRIKLPK